MKATLMIKDLSASKELDRKAMSAVLGGVGDQANGVSQANGQNMVAVANVGIGLVGGPITVQSDNHFTQTAHNYSDQYNVKGLTIGLPFPWVAA